MDRRKERARNAREDWRFRTGGVACDPPGKSYTEGLMELLGWELADGLKRLPFDGSFVSCKVYTTTYTKQAQIDIYKRKMQNTTENKTRGRPCEAFGKVLYLPCALPVRHAPRSNTNSMTINTIYSCSAVTRTT